MVQHQILKTLRAAPCELTEVMEQHPDDGRTAISRRVSEAFGFYDALGRVQHSSCLQALKTLEAEGALSLPTPKRVVRSTVPRLLDEPVPAPVGVPTLLKDVRGLELELVEDAGQRAIWNTLVEAEHPLCAPRFAGRQLRYLVGSEHGYIGAIGFAAAALYLKARDRWMAWSDEQREDYRDHVVGLNRFLIRSMVRIRNLASHTLGKVLRRFLEDFENRSNRYPYDGYCELFNKASQVPAPGAGTGPWAGRFYMKDPPEVHTTIHIHHKFAQSGPAYPGANDTCARSSTLRENETHRTVNNRCGTSKELDSYFLMVLAHERDHEAGINECLTSSSRAKDTMKKLEKTVANSSTDLQDSAQDLWEKFYDNSLTQSGLSGKSYASLDEHFWYYGIIGWELGWVGIATEKLVDNC